MPSVAWPAVGSVSGNAKMALLFQLDQTQWWSRERLQEMQFEQLRELLTHAIEEVPFYADLDIDLSAPLTEERWREIPILQRTDVQQAGARLHARDYPQHHGPKHSVVTSGSTGRPIVSLGNGLTRLFWQVGTLRDHLWQKRDFTGKLFSIRQSAGQAKNVERGRNWGSATVDVIETGPAVGMALQTGAREQARLIAEENPRYLMSYPSNILAIARVFEEEGLTADKLTEIRSFGEALPQGFAKRCRDVWNVRTADLYSSQETGNIALRSPETGDYLVQSETILVEVLDNEGNPCRPGQVGRVILTPLHNLAMPLIRYEIGDYAEVGEDSPCGRGLPVLKRILGRTRNMFTLPGGDQIWPNLDDGELLAELHRHVPPAEQLQLIQHSPEEVEVRMIAAQDLNDEQRVHADRYFQQSLGYPFRMSYTRVQEIPRGTSGKFEEFRSEVLPD